MKSSALMAAVGLWAMSAAVQFGTATLVGAATLVPPDATACEIHVWPATGLHTLTEGAIWNNVIDSAFTTHAGRAPERQVPPHGPMDAAGQQQLLAELDLPALLHNPQAVVIVHDEVSLRRATGGVKGRQIASASPCYVELTVAKNFFNRSGLTSRTLRSLFVLDDFRDQPMPVRSFTAWSTTSLSVFPAKRPEQDDEANAELASAFQTNVRKFSDYAFATPQTK